MPGFVLAGDDVRTSTSDQDTDTVAEVKPVCMEGVMGTLRSAPGLPR